MKKILLIMVLMVSYCLTYAQTHKAKVTPNGEQFWEFLPAGYINPINANKKYPVIIFLHGKGQMSLCNVNPSCDPTAEINKVLSFGPPKEIADGSTMCFTVNNVEECFIVISPQLKQSTLYGPNTAWSQPYIEYWVKYVLNKVNYRVDRNKVYLTGLSLGAIGTYAYALSSPPKYFADSLAAISPAAGKPGSNPNACLLATRDVPVWSFHGNLDTEVSFNADNNLIQALTNCVPQPDPLPKFTIFPGVGHSNVVWNTAYKTDNSSYTPNLYQWFLQNPKGGVVSNPPPLVNAGVDQTINPPANSIILTGTATDNGSIASYLWTKQTGPAATLTNETSATLSVSNMVVGTYTFRLTVTDNLGATAFDEVIVTVNSSNIPPVANAGSDRLINLSIASTATLFGSATDSDGTIVSYQWQKLSGGAITLSSTTVSRPVVSNMLSGTYVFQLTVTDNGGATSSDIVNVVASLPPVSNAGPDQTIFIPATTATLSGSGSDPDGTIASYTWKVFSQPENSIITNTTSATTTVTSLLSGTYIYQLTVKDDAGLTHVDQVSINVVSSGRSASDDVTVIKLDNPALSKAQVVILDASGKKLYEGVWDTAILSERLKENVIYIINSYEEGNKIKSGKYYFIK